MANLLSTSPHRRTISGRRDAECRLEAAVKRPLGAERAGGRDLLDRQRRRTEKVRACSSCFARRNSCSGTQPLRYCLPIFPTSSRRLPRVSGKPLGADVLEQRISIPHPIQSLVDGSNLRCRSGRSVSYGERAKLGESSRAPGSGNRRLDRFCAGRPRVHGTDDGHLSSVSPPRSSERGNRRFCGLLPHSQSPGPRCVPSRQEASFCRHGSWLPFLSERGWWVACSRSDCRWPQTAPD